MTQKNNCVDTGQSNDNQQLDLIGAILQLWHGKWIVTTFIVLAVVLAGTYLFVVKEKWTSTAIITMPDAGQIARYASAMDILNGNVTDTQQNIIMRFSSSFSALSAELENQEVPEELMISSAVRDQSLPLKVSYQGDSSAHTQKRLMEYIQQVDKKTTDELYADLAINIKSKIANLEELLETKEKVSQEQKDLRLKQVAQALKVAQEANIKAPQVQQTQDVTQDTMFLLGSDALTAMIKNEQSRPLIFSEDYYRTRQHLLDLKNIETERFNIPAYHYVMKPNLPIRRDSPKHLLTLMLAVVLGGTVGSGVVFGRNALRNYQRKS